MEAGEEVLEFLVSRNAPGRSRRGGGFFFLRDLARLGAERPAQEILENHQRAGHGRDHRPSLLQSLDARDRQIPGGFPGPARGGDETGNDPVPIDLSQGLAGASPVVASPGIRPEATKIAWTASRPPRRSTSVSSSSRVTSG